MGRCGTNPKILESLEGPEGYLCPGIHILGIVSIYGKPFYTSGSGLWIFLKSRLQNFCYQAELYATLPHCERVRKTHKGCQFVGDVLSWLYLRAESKGGVVLIVM